jgi:ribosomal-protein-alanine N-acetyltransferase
MPHRIEPMTTIIARTERTIVRQMAPADAPFICRLLNEPSWLEHIGDRGVRTPADAEQYIRTTAMATYETLGFGMYLVESRPGAQALGIAGLVKRAALNEPDLGVAFLPEFCRMGYASEAATAVIADAEATLGVARLLAITTPGNQPAIRLLEALDFRFERIVRLAPEERDLRLYARTRSRA